MTPDDLNNEIKLIFARACADGLRAEAGGLMDLASFDLKKATATQYAAAFSSAFAYMSERFIEGPQSYDEAAASALALALAPRSTSATDPQSIPEDRHQELLSLMKLQAETLERISRLLAR
ncbi:hypothetical protein D3C84_761880 [compost metagenome]